MSAFEHRWVYRFEAGLDRLPKRPESRIGLSTSVEDEWDDALGLARADHRVVQPRTRITSDPAFTEVVAEGGRS